MLFVLQSRSGLNTSVAAAAAAACVYVMQVYPNLVATIYKAVFMSTTPSPFYLDCGTLGSTTKLKGCNSVTTTSKGNPKVCRDFR